MGRKLIYIILFLLFYADGIAQKPIVSLGTWKLTKLYGDFNLHSFYRGNERSFNQNYEFHQSGYFSGGLCLKTRSYFWDPNFITLDVNAEYSPETGNEFYLNIPDRSEVRTLKRLDLRTSIFKKNSLSLNAFANLNQSINNRELLTSLKSENKRWGGMLSYRNKALPFTLTYKENLWDQEEIASRRVFKMNQKNFMARTSKSFSDYDSHELNYAHNVYSRQDGDMQPIENNIDQIFLKNRVYFDTQKKYVFRSLITDFIQKGNNEYKRFQVNEQLFLKLPQKLSLTANYQYYNLQQTSQSLNQNRLKATLGHQLFLSLNTNVYYEYFKLRHSFYDEANTRAGIDLTYSKKIPKGHFTLAYKYYRHYQVMDAQNTFINEINEEHVLSDGQIVLLNRPYIDPATIIVKDITGTIIFQRDFDYILIERNNFIEIQRLPGGQIPNNEIVYIDYTAVQPGSYQYDANNNALSANIILFNRLIELYFRASKQEYSSLINVDHITLNRYTQTLVGGKVDVGFAIAGIEYDNYNSNIIPYRMVRYYINLQKTFYKRLLCSLNGNIRDYEKTTDKIPQQFSDISGKIIYRFKLRSKISLEGAYRKQQGDGIDLDLFTGRSEFETKYRQMIFKVGMNMYRRNNIGNKTVFNSVYGKIIRKFKL
ncbi:MAG: hypothetical protein ABFS35_00555 [Bacteroidota bacterium]